VRSGRLRLPGERGERGRLTDDRGAGEFQSLAADERQEDAASFAAVAGELRKEGVVVLGGRSGQGKTHGPSAPVGIDAELERRIPRRTLDDDDRLAVGPQRRQRRGEHARPGLTGRGEGDVLGPGDGLHGEAAGAGPGHVRLTPRGGFGRRARLGIFRGNDEHASRAVGERGEQGPVDLRANPDTGHRDAPGSQRGERIGKFLRIDALDAGAVADVDDGPRSVTRAE